ncbi:MULTISPECIES: hypothetical protein [unclassified Nocardia]|uniref:hypothetical protein n=1 Tax=unclassified Nocardia TaxID=2637762 RepID=UPI00278C5847|nr:MULTISPECIES: hypothetical protein [unclassified Nocardia]
MSRVALGLIHCDYSDDPRADTLAIAAYVEQRGWRFPRRRPRWPHVSVLLVLPGDSAYSEFLMAHTHSEATALIVPTLAHVTGIEAITRSRTDVYSLDGHNLPRRPYRELLGLDS